MIEMKEENYKLCKVRKIQSVITLSQHSFRQEMISYMEILTLWMVWHM